MKNIIVVLLAVVGVYFYATFERVEAYTNSYQPVVVTGSCLTHDDMVTLELPVPQFNDFTSDARQTLQHQYLIDACDAIGGIM